MGEDDEEVFELWGSIELDSVLRPGEAGNDEGGLGDVRGVKVLLEACAHSSDKNRQS